jgi:ribosomal protein L14
VIRAISVHTSKKLKLKCNNGDDNATVIIDQEGNPRGTSIFGC